ncbi:MAG: hypothetical protein JW889_07670 [Verrucomicrobia bacterium]|nr:hypothetical protein [Verrucomicrobiota bacterium]
MSVLQNERLLNDAAEIEVREFRGKRGSLPLLILGSAIVPVVLALWVGGVDNWAYGIVAVLFAPWLIAAQLRNRKSRLLLGAPGMVIVTHGGKQAVLWADVQSAVHITNDKRLLLHLPGERTVTIIPDAYDEPDQLRKSIESYLAGRVTVQKIRSDAAKSPAALLIVLLFVVVMGFIFLAAVERKGAMLAAGVGITVGAGVGAVLLRQAPPARKRLFVKAFLTVSVSTLALFVLYTALMFLLRRRLYTRWFWVVVVLLCGYAIGLVLVPLIARTIRIQRHVQQAIRRNVSDRQPAAGDQT